MASFSLGPAFRPHQRIPGSAYAMLVAVWSVLAVLVWWILPPPIPGPGEVMRELGRLVSDGGLLGDLWTSLVLFAEALAISTALALVFAYLTTMPALRPPVNGLTRTRFLSLVGFLFVFTVFVGGGHGLKLALLTYGITPFLLTSMVDIVASVPNERIDHARTLRMGDWRVVWEVVVLGQLGPTLDAIRQNAAMGWMMLTMVEGLVRSEGGIGTLLMDQDKHLRLAAVFAIQIVFLVAGFAQDAFLAWLKRVLAPYALLSTEER
ncbi:MAG TPA: hypothetical protein VFH27_12780 [Longimicrobiaceae bacterium]|nr:hypothetical protein [Longimicrobiaceae bacterium]